MAFSFDDTPVRLATTQFEDAKQSSEIGLKLAQQLNAPDLKAVLLLSDGLHVNGSRLIAGMQKGIAANVPIFGGMAGDGSDFGNTVVMANAAATSKTVAAVGFYGSRFQIGTGSAGGWDEFGPKRKISKSDGNVLYELDGKPALDLYKRYLGEEAEKLPGSALLYPLLVFNPDDPQHKRIRTVLSVDAEKKSMIFAGDIPEGWTAQLMKGQFDRLTASAANAVEMSMRGHDSVAGECSTLLVSCIGRRLLMGEYVTDELDAAVDATGGNQNTFGFYSYGEFSPHASSGVCELHNQTMTAATFWESKAA
jgi:hypothetical protein